MESGYNNLRSIKAIITNFERVYGDINKLEVPNEHTAKILYGFCIKSFETKPKIHQNEGSRFILDIYNEDKKATENNKQLAGKYNGEGISIISIQQWIETGKYDEEAVVS